MCSLSVLKGPFVPSSSYMYVSFLKCSTEVESASKESLDFLRSFALACMAMSYVTEKNFVSQEFLPRTL